MESFSEKWFNRYNDTWGSDLPFRLPPKDVKIGLPSILLRGLVLLTLALPIGIVTALLTVLASSMRYWYPYVASGKVSLVLLISTYWAVTFKQHSTLLLVGVPILTLALFLLGSVKYYYWNRRADRINRDFPPTVADEEAEASVWPPPPTVITKRR